MSEWISVKDRLPDHGEFVLGYNGGFVTEMEWGGTFKSPADHRCYYSDVTHWMPLPSPPEPPPAPTLTVKEALKQAIAVLDQTACNLRCSRHSERFNLDVCGINDVLPRLRAALESEE